MNPGLYIYLISGIVTFLTGVFIFSSMDSTLANPKTKVTIGTITTSLLVAAIPAVNTVLGFGFSILCFVSWYASSSTADRVRKFFSKELWRNY